MRITYHWKVSWNFGDGVRERLEIRNLGRTRPEDDEMRPCRLSGSRALGVAIGAFTFSFGKVFCSMYRR